MTNVTNLNQYKADKNQSANVGAATLELSNSILRSDLEIQELITEVLNLSDKQFEAVDLEWMRGARKRAASKVQLSQ